MPKTELCTYCFGHEELETALETGEIVTQPCPGCSGSGEIARPKVSMKEAMEAAANAVEGMGKPIRRSA